MAKKTKSDYLDNIQLEKNILNFVKAKQETKRYEMLIEDIKSSNLKRGKDHFDLPKFEAEYVKSKNVYEISQVFLINAFYLIAKNVVAWKRFKFVEADDAIQEGIIISFERIEKFDPSRGSPAFNFLTTCIYNHLKQQYRSASNYNNFIKKYQDHINVKFQNNIIIKNGKEFQNN